MPPEDQDQSRRDFLTGMGIVAGGVAMAATANPAFQKKRRARQLLRGRP